jgi:hypothetical protein
MARKEAAPQRCRVQVYLTDPKVVSGLNREARSGKMPLSQAAGRAIARGLQKQSPELIPRIACCSLNGPFAIICDPPPATCRSCRSCLIEVARAFFVRLPDAIVDEDPTVQAAVDRRIERLLDATAARIVAGRRERPVPDEERSFGQTN